MRETLIHPESASTQWSAVLLAGDTGSPDSRVALESLCQRYWMPLYAFARRGGMRVEEAQDVTQSFFGHFLEKGYIRAADPNRGRFRSFLLTAFRHFCINEWARLRRLKRGGTERILPWEELPKDRATPEPSAHGLSPDRYYDHQWALAVMERALAQLKMEFETANHHREFALLKRYLSVPADDGEYQKLGENLGLRPGNVALRIHRLRLRYAELVRAEVAQTVGDRRDVEDELRYLVGLVAGQ